MKYIVGGYDVGFAVSVLKELLYTEVKSEDYNERLKESVWDKTLAFLQDFASSSPRQMTCFFGKQFRFPNHNGCKCRNIFIVNQQGGAAYLGTVFNLKAVATLEKLVTSQDWELLEKNPGKIIRGVAYQVIPSDSDEIDETIVIKSVGKYMASYQSAPNEPAIAALVKLVASGNIGLLSAEKGAMFDERIRKKAKKLALSDS